MLLVMQNADFVTLRSWRFTTASTRGKRCTSSAAIVGSGPATNDYLGSSQSLGD
jgi:hypothetical protein